MRAIILVLCLAACGPPNVGAACTASGGCDDGLTCSTAFTGGYCTKSCPTPGSTNDCPEASVCDDVTGAGRVCLKMCSSDNECRSGVTACNGITGSSQKACHPK
jgi:hypothetical protein